MITMQSLIALLANMASITIRNLDERTKARLRVRAAHGKRSMEEEARHILRKALSQSVEGSPDLGLGELPEIKATGRLQILMS